MAFAEDFFNAYVECALWSSLTDDGKPLDDDYSADDLTADAIATMRDDCENFVIVAEPHLTAANVTAEQAGHDFWLTRNHHGAGFWDRGLGKLGDTLTDLADTFGTCDLHVTDDGRIDAA